MEYREDEYTDEEEYQDNFIEPQREGWEDSGNFPEGRKPESLFSLFNNVWRAKDSSKVANLDSSELGDLGLSVRDCQRISLLSKLLHHDKFAGYFFDQGEITLGTSMSKKGWFVELFVTSKKFAHKGVMNLKQNQKPKWRLFGKPKAEIQELA